MNKPNILAS